MKITTSNPHFSLARENLSPLFPSSLSGQLACCCRSQGTLHGASALVTTLLPEHPVPGAARSTIGHCKSSDFCADRSSEVCSGWSWREFVISRSGVQPSSPAPGKSRDCEAYQALPALRVAYTLRAVASASRSKPSRLSPGTRCPYTSTVVWIEAWPSCCWMNASDSPLWIKSELYVWRFDRLEPARRVV